MEFAWEGVAEWGGEGKGKIQRKSNNRAMAVSMLFLQLERWPAMDRTPQFSMFIVSASLGILTTLARHSNVIYLLEWAHERSNWWSIGEGI